MRAQPNGSNVTLVFASLLVTVLVVAAVSDWKPLSKGDAMKALFATLFAAMFAAMAVMAYAAPVPGSAEIQFPLPSDDDKDKDKEKDKKGD
jgi:hypothetical protein